MQSAVIADLFRKIDLDLQLAKLAEARQSLCRIELRFLPRSEMAQFARLCRRAGLITRGLRALTPYVRGNETTLRSSVTAEEKLEYAVLLQRAGAVREAQALLSEVPTDQFPIADLYRAYCYFNVWDYGAALPSLLKYVEHSEGYQKRIANVNLIAAWVETNMFDQALQALDILIPELQAAHQSRLLANAHELRSQIGIKTGDLKLAEFNLEKAAQILKSTSLMEGLFVKKWQAVLESRRTGQVDSILKFKSELVGHPETQREMDLHHLAVSHSEALFERLYVGTPYAKYRVKILETLSMKPPEGRYIFGAGKLVDIQNMQIASDPGREFLPLGSYAHRTLSILARDFYKPIRVGEVFAELYPNEYFDIFSSPKRVQKNIERLGRSLAVSGSDLQILNMGQGYFLKTGKMTALQIPFQDGSALTRDSLYIKDLKLRWGTNNYFSARDAAEALKLTVGQFARFVKRVEPTGLLQIYGAGPTTSYCLR